MILLYVIMAVIGIVNMILFWMLCKNVSILTGLSKVETLHNEKLMESLDKITTSLMKVGETHQSNYLKHLTFDNKEAAKEALIEMIWMRFEKDRQWLTQPASRQQTLDRIQIDFEIQLKEMGMTLPEPRFK